MVENFLSPMTRGLRIVDQETARTVGILGPNGTVPIGAGCLVSGDRIVTCRHVAARAQGLAASSPADLVGMPVRVALLGVEGKPIVEARVVAHGGVETFEDVAVLGFGEALNVAPVDFVTPLRHGGKRFSVYGFPTQDRHGRNATGSLHAINALELVQMDATGSVPISGGFSGAPVWCADVGGFVGIVVSELNSQKISWCLPSRMIARLMPDLAVRFAVPPADRPVINDYWLDDPNPQIFGSLADAGGRRLTARVAKSEDEEWEFVVTATYTVHGGPPPRGRYVTFVTHPSFADEFEDAYVLPAKLDSRGVATVEFYPTGAFTLAAVGDAGDTALTLDLAGLPRLPEGFV